MWAGAVLVAVAAVGGWAARPDGPPADTSADVGFARAMADHHAQAVEMAELVRFRTNDPEIRLLATDIVLTQQAQIGQMRGWLEAWGRPMTGRGDAMAWMGHGPGAMPGMASRGDIDRLDAATGAAADELFLRLMIRHHQGGVVMAQAALEQADENEVRRLAGSIVDGQRAEIEAMKVLLGRLAERSGQRSATGMTEEAG